MKRKTEQITAQGRASDLATGGLVRALAVEIHTVALAAVRKSEGYTDGVNKPFEDWPPRLKTSMTAIAEHILKRPNIAHQPTPPSGH